MLLSWFFNLSDILHLISAICAYHVEKLKIYSIDMTVILKSV